MLERNCLGRVAVPAVAGVDSWSTVICSLQLSKAGMAALLTFATVAIPDTVVADSSCFESYQ